MSVVTSGCGRWGMAEPCTCQPAGRNQEGALCEMYLFFRGEVDRWRHERPGRSRLAQEFLDAHWARVMERGHG